MLTGGRVNDTMSGTIHKQWNLFLRIIYQMNEATNVRTNGIQVMMMMMMMMMMN